MITASELGMLCARHRIKNASWLTEGVRSWFTPKPPEMNVTKDQKPQAQPNPYAKASEQPFGAAKGLPKANPKQSITPFASGSAKAEEAAQAAARPQYDYFRPPTGDFKTQIKPYEYFKDLYAKYPGGYDKAIADAQRWQNDAQLEGLHTWKPEDLHNPVDVRGGSFVGPWENSQTPFIATGRHGGFTDKNNPVNAGAYQEINRSGNGWNRNPNSIMMNPENVNTPASNPWLRSAVGHELTHAMHRNASNLLTRTAQNFAMDDGALGLPNVFKGHESNFPEKLRNDEFGVKYYGRPTEFSAHLSELRRHWIQNNPGKALNNVPVAEALLQHYNPARDVQPGDKPVPRPNAGFQNFLPTIMSDPKLKQKAITAILSSVVQNKQRQAPGTNV